MLDATVKYFDNTMTGAPVMAGNVGALITLLDNCLVSGFGLSAITSLEIENGVGTVITGGHGLTMVGSVGPVVRIDGCTDAAINRDWRVLSIPSGTTFTFDATGVVSGLRSGTMTAKRAPLGWEKRYSDAGRAAYARTDPESTEMLLRVTDSATQIATLDMFEDMTDLDTGTRSATVYAVKSSFSGGSARAWTLIGDSRAFYLLIDRDGNGEFGTLIFFGDPIKVAAADAFFCMLVSSTKTDTTQWADLLYGEGSTTGKYVCRSYTQAGGARLLGMRLYSDQSTTTYSGRSKNTYPCPVTQGLLIHSDFKLYEGYSIRGMFPGIYDSSHPMATFSNRSTFNIASGLLSGKTLLFHDCKQRAYVLCCLWFDITGPWR